MLWSTTQVWKYDNGHLLYKSFPVSRTHVWDVLVQYATAIVTAMMLLIDFVYVSNYDSIPYNLLSSFNIESFT